MTSPDPAEITLEDRPKPRRRRWRIVAVVLLAVVLCFCAASGRLFIWPATSMPAHVDAVVVLGGQGDRLGKGLALVRQGRAPVVGGSGGVAEPVAASVGAPPSRTYKVICFQPDPGTTQGEAQFIGRIAKQ